jgi:hypothetical protein
MLGVAGESLRTPQPKPNNPFEQTRHGATDHRHRFQGRRPRRSSLAPSPLNRKYRPTNNKPPRIMPVTWPAV